MGDNDAMERRKFLKLAGNIALVAGVGAALRYKVLPPSPSAKIGDVDTLTRQLVASFDSADRAVACVDYDHPLRQYHNRGVSTGGLSVWSLSWDQRKLATDLFYAGLSEAGRARMPEEQLISIPGVHALDLLICGDPQKPPYQVILSGAHVNLRLGGENREGVAFGGPQVYGDQRGNDSQGLPGNLYRYQFEMAHRLFQTLSAAERRVAVLPTAPIQTQIELQGRDGVFAGVGVETLPVASKVLVRELLGGILSTYREADAEYAWRCLDRNGGIDALHLSYYRDGEVDGSGQYQIFRLEGPAAVFYFRGAPHVHAFVNVAMNGDAPLSVGEVVAENPSMLEGAGVKALFERAMFDATGSDLAYYGIDGVVGKLRKGTIRTGDLYNLESWQNRIVLLEAKGVDIAGKLGSDFKAQLDPARTYRLATTNYAAGLLGSFRPEKVGMLREATISYARRFGVG
ncbi:MAG TPA: DUF3500 domain-containing protein [Steroidobacteraceae bacterium]|nr:DUF3500 domain-containing protein [Steroidobacteraceae bacterium]